MFKFKLGAIVHVPCGANMAATPARIVARTERIDGPPLYYVETLGCVRARLTVAEAEIALPQRECVQQTATAV